MDDGDPFFIYQTTCYTLGAMLYVWGFSLAALLELIAVILLLRRCWL